METKTLKGQTLVKIAIITSVLAIFQSIPALISSINQMNIIQSIFDGAKPDHSALAASDNLQQIFGIISLVIYIPFFILFLIWFRNSYQNLEIFNIKTKYKSGWAIGSFFVPILGFIRPYKICKEILIGSSLKQVRIADKLLIFVWWIIFWISNITGNILLRSIPGEHSELQNFVSYSQMTVFSDLLNIVLYPLFLLVIVRIRFLQTEKLTSMREVVKEEN